jgi:transposase InsO family protein
VYDLLFRALFIFVIIELETRRIVHIAVIRSPTDAWVAQQVREATPWGESPKYLIHDRDKKYGKQFTSVTRSTGIEELRTPYQAPKANAICERWLGSMKREWLDHTLIPHRHHLSRVVKEYADYHSRSRPHQGIGQRIPARLDERDPTQSGRSMATLVRGGLHNSYSPVPYPK